MAHFCFPKVFWCWRYQGHQYHKPTIHPSLQNSTCVPILPVLGERETTASKTRVSWGVSLWTVGKPVHFLLPSLQLFFILGSAHSGIDQSICLLSLAQMSFLLDEVPVSVFPADREQEIPSIFLQATLPVNLFNFCMFSSPYSLMLGMNN